MTQNASESSRTTPPPLGRFVRRVRDLQHKVGAQVQEHFGAELKELEGTRRRVMRRISRTSGQLSELARQEEGRLPGLVVTTLVQVGEVVGRWADATGAASTDGAANGREPAAQADSPRRSKSSRPRRRRKPPREHAEAGGGEGEPKAAPAAPKT